jgi:hypothetical protein
LLPGLWRWWGFHLPCCRGAFLGPLGEVLPAGTNRQLDPDEGLVLPASWGEGLRCTTEPSEVQEPARGGDQCLSDW